MHILVIGGGISGLSAAWFVKKNHPHAKVTVLEKEKRLGGWIQTDTIDGYLFERGPRSLRPHPDTLTLIKELDLEINPASKAAHKRYLWHQGKLRKVPQGVLELLFSPWVWPVIPSLFKEWRIPPSSEEDETVHAFISRRFSPLAADLFIDPLVKGIFAGDPKKLSIRACFPQLWEWEKTEGSILKGVFWSSFDKKAPTFSLYTLEGGMQALVDRLAEKMGADCKLDEKALRLLPKNETVQVVTQKGIYHADHVILAVPPEPLAALVPSLYEPLRSIPMASLTTFACGFKGNILPKNGFGYLIPSIEKESILGAVFDSSAFPQKSGQTRMTIMAAGTISVEEGLAALKKHLGIQEDPNLILRRVMEHAIPQYQLRHLNKIEQIEAGLKAITPRLHLTGNAFYGVSVNDCIARGKKIVIQ